MQLTKVLAKNGSIGKWTSLTLRTISCVVRFTTLYIMHRKSETVVDLIHKIQFLFRPKKTLNTTRINIIVITISYLMLIYPAIITCLVAMYDDELNFSIVLYEAKFELVWVRNVCFFLKGTLTDFLPQINVTLMLGLYLVLCHKLSTVVMNLTKQVDVIPVDEFLTIQTLFLKKHLEITDAIE